MFIDTHSHVNFDYFNEDADEVIKRALGNEVEVINVGVDYKSSKKALSQSNKYADGVYAAVGLHPTSLVERTEKRRGVEKTVPAEEFSRDLYEQLAKFPKVVAVGEIGLDFFPRNLDYGNAREIKERQIAVFKEQLEFAVKLNLPVIIHCRQAHDDMIKILTDFRQAYRDVLPQDRPWGVMHCFSGDENLAWQYFNLGLLISFTGLITFSKNWDSLIRKMPDEKLILETDSPFMTPEPYRGRRNEPVLVKYVGKRIAEIKGVSLDEVERYTTANAKRLFKLD